GGDSRRAEGRCLPRVDRWWSVDGQGARECVDGDGAETRANRDGISISTARDARDLFATVRRHHAQCQRDPPPGLGGARSRTCRRRQFRWVLGAGPRAVGHCRGRRADPRSGWPGHSVRRPRGRAEVRLHGVRQPGQARVRPDNTGGHQRMGATAVVPFVPGSGITMDECVALARALGERVGKELQIPVFFYARAATRPERVLLPDVRKGEFEGMQGRVLEPDFGPNRVHATAGATAIGARPFLVAYNVYLDTKDVAIAKEIAK